MNDESPWMVAAGLAGVALLLLTRSSRSRSRARRPTSVEYAQQRLPLLLARARDPRIRATWQEHRALLPGVPFSAFVALSVSSEGPQDATPDARGLFGVEPSRLERYRHDNGLLSQFGASPLDDYAQDIEWQTFTGLVRYADALAEARAMVSGLNSSTIGSFEYQSTVCSYSAGPSTLRALAMGAPTAWRTPIRADRWTRLAEDTLPAIRTARRWQGRPVRGVAGIAWGLVRPRQRFEAGRLLAGQLQGVTTTELRWYDSPPWPEVEDRALATLAWARR